MEQNMNNMSYEELKNAYKELQIKYNNLQLENNSLKRMVFGSKREKTPKVDSEQISIFETEKEIEEDLQKQRKENVEEITVYRRKNNKKQNAGIKKEFLKDVEFEENEIILNDDEKCPECGEELKLISKKVVRKEIKVIPAKLVVTTYVQARYKCKKCGSKDSEKETPTFVLPEVPKALLPHSFASASLATEIIYNKYYMGVPLYRQEKMWDDKGLILPRTMMANWCIKINEYYLEKLWRLMLKRIKESSEVLHCDETTIQCNKEPGKKATSSSYMWVLRSGDLESQKGVIFKYAPSRSSEIAKWFLGGYKGILVTDGYAGYNPIEDVTHAECWAHTRRYFYDSVPVIDKKMVTTTDSYKGLEYCNKLFEIEREIALFGVQEKQQARQEKSKPILKEFFAWVHSVLNNKIVVNDKLNKALVYAANQEKELSEFLNDGRIPIDNSGAERAIRPFAVHRKNWLFADSQAGANANATMYSIIESAKLNNLNIWKYMNYLLEQLPQVENISDEQYLEKYLPWSKELPKEILNYQTTSNDEEKYKELTVVSEI